MLALLALLAVFAKAWLGVLPMLIVILLIVASAWLVRNPLRRIPASPLGVVSPACGTLVSVENCQDRWLNRPAVRFVIDVTLLDVHTLYSPIEGKVMKEWPEGSGETLSRRRHSYWLRTDEGDDITLSLVLDRRAPYVGMTIHAGERVGQGQQCGFLYFAGKVEVYLPENSRLHAKAGERIDAGSDILGHLLHANGVSVLGDK